MEYYGHPELRTTPAYPMDPICWIRHFINIALANLQEPRLKTKRRESMPWDAHFHIFAGPVQHCNARTWWGHEFPWHSFQAKECWGMGLSIGLSENGGEVEKNRPGDFNTFWRVLWMVIVMFIRNGIAKRCQHNIPDWCCKMLFKLGTRKFMFHSSSSINVPSMFHQCSQPWPAVFAPSAPVFILQGFRQILHVRRGQIPWLRANRRGLEGLGVISMATCYNYAITILSSPQ